MPMMETRVVDVSDTAYEAGFACKVYLTAEVWEKCGEWTEEDNERQDYQDWEARLWDLLFVPANRMKMGGFHPVTGLTYQIHCLLRDGTSTEATLTFYKIIAK